MMLYQPRHMLVTGGAGFIGANFIRHILNHEPDINIINLDKLTYAGSLKNLENLPRKDHHQFIHGDINNRLQLKEILDNYSIDTIVHFAAESHVDRSIEEPLDFIHTNVLGTFNLLTTALDYWQTKFQLSPRHCRFHHISTDEVYGSLSLDDTAFTELTPYQPRSPYSASKAASDHLVNAYHHTFQLPVTISNCSNNYGPYQHLEKFIPTVIRACLKWDSIPIYGNGKNIRDWLYVEDHCRGILKIIQYGEVGKNYNLGGNNEIDNISLAKYICSKFDELKPQTLPYESLLAFIKDRPGHDFRYAINSSLAQEKLGWKPLENFSTGIKKTIQFYQNL